MTDEVRQELESIPLSYTDYHLTKTAHNLLTSKEQRELPAELANCMAPFIEVGKSMTPDQKAKLLYDVLSRSLVYDRTAYPPGEGMRRYTYAGGLTSGKAVCMGIAELYTMLGTAFGLRVQTIIGYGGDPVHKGGLHAWNLVWLPGSNSREIPYHIDLTWDLAPYSSLTGYRYFLKSDAYMQSNDHTWLPERYPRCPESRTADQIPRIPGGAVDMVIRSLATLRRSQTN